MEDSFPKTRDYLYSLRDRGSKYGIERMQQFVAALEQPQQRFPVIHVAGTNGKGSTCALLESIYRANGYSTGLFTSPHLIHLGERVQINRSPLTEEEILDYTETLRPVAERLGERNIEEYPSFFEFITAIAFLHFAKSKVDLAILETGLGGRLDATNVVDPELSIITSISLDHTDLLGDTLALIAKEKAGILKPGKPVLLGRLPNEAERVICDIATERDCQVHRVTDRFNQETLPHTNLPGNFQRWNAALAVQATEILAEKFPIRTTNATQRVNWAGRWQRIELPDRSLILDATHNPEGCQVLEENLIELRQTEGRKPTIIAGALGEQRAQSLMPVVARHASQLHLVEPDQPRACSSKFLLSCLPPNHAVPTTSDSIEILFPEPQICTAGNPGETIVVTGSIYLLGEVMERLQGDTDRRPHLQDKI